MVEQIAVSFRCGFQASEKIRELFYVPFANVAHNPLPFHAIGARRPPIGMGVVVMARSSEAEPRKAANTLALGEHVGGNASLSSD